jgi:ubiquinone/menaquinone biosynthesis C-methylase UbiE
MLNIQSGDKVLELGCGPSTTSPIFCHAAGLGGIVVGADYDAGMIQQAKINANYSNLVHLVADAHRLPFEDYQFDRLYAKRLFQVLPPSSAPRLTSEMYRVLKPNGTIVLVDTDWSSVSVNYSDLELERRLTSFFRDHVRPNGLAGRQLPTLIQQTGFIDAEAKAMSMVIPIFAETPFKDWLVGEALKAKVATSEELGNWCTELELKTQQGAFLFQVATVLVSAKKRS